MTGIHVVRRRIPSGVKYYVYAWRGGPCIHTTYHIPPVITQSILNKQQRAIADFYAKRDGDTTLNKLITAYENSPSFKALAHSTRKEYSRYLNMISAQFGKMPLSSFNDRKMRGSIIAWRDEYQETPRTADLISTTVSILLNYGVETGQLEINVASKIKNLHKVDRSDLIWEDRHWKAFYDANPPQRLIDIVVLASLTGARSKDLIALTWNNVSLNSIIIDRTSKKKTRAVIPITKDLRLWLDARTDREGHLLKNSRGYPWSSDGIKTTFKKYRPEGFDRTIHDLRGTYATSLMLKGLTDSEIAMIMAWETQNIAQIRARYVNEQRVIVNIAERLQN